MSTLIPKALTITGLLLDIIGVCLLAYDALYGVGRHWWLGILEGQLKEAERIRDSALTTWRQMADTGAREGYVSMLEQETLQKYDEQRRRIEERIQNWRDLYPNKVRDLAMRGLLLLVLGFVLQILGAVWS